jgi:hypothetical protein
MMFKAIYPNVIIGLFLCTVKPVFRGHLWDKGQVS